MKKGLQNFRKKKRVYIKGLLQVILISGITQFFNNPSLAQINGLNGSIQQAWVSRYTGPVNGDDEASAIAVDNSGFVYATGYMTTIDGYPFNHDYATIKYDELSGDTLWVARYDGPADVVDEATAVKVDDQGNVYVTGNSGSDTIFPFNLDYATIKYSSDGTSLWINRYNGPGNGTDYGRALAIDVSGNVYVTGASLGDGTGYDFATIKYSSSGTEEWVARYDGPVSGDDESFAIALDNSGNVYVTGYSMGAGTFLDYLTIKYNASGNMLWVSRYNGPGNDQDQANDVKVDGSGYVYVTGQSTGAGTGFDYATIKYDMVTGDSIWVRRYNGTDFYYDYARAIAIDNSSDIYVTGYSTSPVTGYDYTTIKYSSSGTEEWVERYSSPGNNFDLANAIAVDGSGSVYITGRCNRSGSFFEYTTVKYNSTGNEEWVMNYSGPGNSDDEASAIALDNNGNVFITGFSTGTDTFYNVATIKYEPVPTPVELSSFNAKVIKSNVALSWTTATEINDKGFEIQRLETENQTSGSKVSPDVGISKGNWIEIGFVNGNGTTTESKSYSYVDENVTEGRYSYRLKQIDFNGSYKYSEEINVTVVQPQNFSLFQNYPNPFNPSTQINYSIKKDGFVSLKVYNILGQKVANLVNEKQTSGSHSVNFSAGFLPGGVYIYRLQSGKFSDSKKMLLLK